MARTWGGSSAAPTPWAMRASTRPVASGAAPQAAEASVNRAEADDEQAPAAVRVTEPAAEDQ